MGGGGGIIGGGGWQGAKVRARSGGGEITNAGQRSMKEGGRKKENRCLASRNKCRRWNTENESKYEHPSRHQHSQHQYKINVHNSFSLYESKRKECLRGAAMSREGADEKRRQN